MFFKKTIGGYLNPVEGIHHKTIAFGKNTLMAEFLLHANSKLPRHSHPHEQTGYLISGHIRLFIGDESFLCHPGDSWCIPGNVEHSADVIENAVAIEVFSPVREDYLPKKSE
ncbi:MAG: cupin domain-containing protein [Desulfobacteraceae bacterium]|nr:cupin domain-containing protein [Desulfobacteraceae bacterium]